MYATRRGDGGSGGAAPVAAARAEAVLLLGAVLSAPCSISTRAFSISSRDRCSKLRVASNVLVCRHRQPDAFGKQIDLAYACMQTVQPATNAISLVQSCDFTMAPLT